MVLKPKPAQAKSHMKILYLDLVGWIEGSKNNARGSEEDTWSFSNGNGTRKRAGKLMKRLRPTNVPRVSILFSDVCRLLRPENV